jgi:hypothetical protein
VFPIGNTNTAGSEDFYKLRPTADNSGNATQAPTIIHKKLTSQWSQGCQDLGSDKVPDNQETTEDPSSGKEECLLTNGECITRRALQPHEIRKQARRLSLRDRNSSATLQALEEFWGERGQEQP